MKIQKLFLSIASLVVLCGCSTPTDGDILRPSSTSEESIPSESSQSGGGDSSSSSSSASSSEASSSEEQPDEYRVSYITLSDRDKYLRVSQSGRYYLTVKFFDENGQEISTSDMSDDEYELEWTSSNTSVIEVNQYGGVLPKGLGDAYVDCVTTKAYRHARCYFHIVNSLDDITREYRKVTNLSDLKAGDILVFGAPQDNKAMSLDLSAGDLAGVATTYSSDKSKITNLGDNVGEFMLDGSTNNWTLESQNGKYFCAFNLNRVGFVNKTGNIHRAFTYDDGELYIESTSEVRGWLMYNQQTNKFTMYESNPTFDLYMPTIYKSVIVS